MSQPPVPPNQPPGSPDSPGEPPYSPGRPPNQTGQPSNNQRYQPGQPPYQPPSQPPYQPGQPPYQPPSQPPYRPGQAPYQQGQPPYQPGQAPYSARPQQPSRGLLILIASLLAVSALVAITVTVVAVTNANDKPAGRDSSARTQPADPGAVEFRRVLTSTPGTCPTPAPAGTACGDGFRYTLGKVELNGSNVSEVKAAEHQDSPGRWFVELTLDADDAKRFELLTADLAKQPPPTNQLAIVVRGQVVVAPAVQSAIPNGKVQLTGNYSRGDAQELVGKITG
ncbi:hypothetical protein [Kribbella sp. NPDC048915]|uniref:SecDF P1 head subdomain-containing protein n=1 Tax=Kribbella sp. NPDC048915 TaxID=3155148 RepID=UPI0033DA9D53